jgi:hypothetical protein
VAGEQDEGLPNFGIPVCYTLEKQIAMGIASKSGNSVHGGGVVVVWAVLSRDATRHTPTPVDLVGMTFRRRTPARGHPAPNLLFVMPFYLAIPRNATFSGAVQKGSMVKSDFVRTQPSQLIYNVVSEHSGPMYTMLSDRLNSVILAHAAALEKRTAVRVDFSDKFTYIPAVISSLPPFVIPKVQVRFKGQPPPSAQEVIDRLGADVKRLRGNTTDTYTFKTDNMEDFADLMNLEGVDGDFKPTEGAISVPQIEHLALIYTRISVVAAGLHLISPFNQDKLEIVTAADVPLLPPTETTEEMSVDHAPR